MRLGWVLALAWVTLVTPATAAWRAHPPAATSLLRPIGPPPRAPLQGQRHRHASGVELRYDAALGAYVVPDAPALYFFGGLFLRHRRGVWQSSEGLRGPWRASRAEWIPLALRALHYAQEP